MQNGTKGVLTYHFFRARFTVSKRLPGLMWKFELISTEEEKIVFVFYDDSSNLYCSINVDVLLFVFCCLVNQVLIDVQNSDVKIIYIHICIFHIHHSQNSDD